MRKKRRFIIISSIASIVLCLSLIIVSVYASLNQTFSVSNIIGFKPSDMIYVSLDCSVSGARQSTLSQAPDGYSSLDEYQKIIGLVHKVEFDESMRGQPQDLESNDVSWNITESLDFLNAKTPIIYTIKVYNYSEQKIRVYITDYTSNDSISNVASNSVVIDGYTPNSSQQPSSGTVTLSTSVVNSAKSFKSEPNNFKVVFTIEQ